MDERRTTPTARTSAGERATRALKPETPRPETPSAPRARTRAVNEPCPPTPETTASTPAAATGTPSMGLSTPEVAKPGLTKFGEVPRTGSQRAAATPATLGGPAVGEDEAEWRPWLAGGSSREVLARIVNEDPLDVRRHVARALREGAWLLDADRVLLRCFALVARHATRYRGRPPVREWLDLLAREAIDALVREDGDGERRPLGDDAAAAREVGPAFLALARPLGLEPEALSRACAGFNRLPHADRAAFHALVIAGRSLEELTRESGDPAIEIARRARRALDVLLAADNPRTERPRAVNEPEARSASEVAP